MYKKASARLSRRNKKVTVLNLVPILDAVFIFIFFLLVSTNFLSLTQIETQVPIISENLEDSDKDPLGLTLLISKTGIEVLTGVDGRVIKEIKKSSDGHDLLSLQETLISLKANHGDETTAILEPSKDVNYLELIKIMDATRINAQDQSELFGNILFGNIDRELK